MLNLISNKALLTRDFPTCPAQTLKLQESPKKLRKSLKPLKTNFKPKEANSGEHFLCQIMRNQFHP